MFAWWRWMSSGLAAAEDWRRGPELKRHFLRDPSPGSDEDGPIPRHWVFRDDGCCPSPRRVGLGALSQRVYVPVTMAVVRPLSRRALVPIPKGLCPWWRWMSSDPQRGSLGALSQRDYVLQPRVARAFSRNPRVKSHRDIQPRRGCALTPEMASGTSRQKHPRGKILRHCQ